MARSMIMARLEALSTAERKIVSARPLQPFLCRPALLPVASPAVSRARMSTAAEPAQVDDTLADQPSISRVSVEHEQAQKGLEEYAKKTLKEAVAAKAPRHNWTRKEIAAIYYRPLIPELVYNAVSFHGGRGCLVKAARQGRSLPPAGIQRQTSTAVSMTPPKSSSAH